MPLDNNNISGWFWHQCHCWSVGHFILMISYNLCNFCTILSLDVISFGLERFVRISYVWMGTIDINILRWFQYQRRPFYFDNSIILATWSTHLVPLSRLLSSVMVWRGSWGFSVSPLGRKTDLCYWPLNKYKANHFIVTHISSCKLTMFSADDQWEVLSCPAMMFGREC